ncbi:MAG: Asp-tRNA(Asn)/Glu-tRNA(Gln) amidotransferase subunit GatC [bacterium]|nr:Asp-tRNA(Asn)/Glu-tRNA(Gln) amidotransferase subunit GatC [bacterium]
MEITNEKIEQLAHLARLEFDEQGKINIKKDLENILVLCEKLNEINTDGIEPLIYITDTQNNVRKDELIETISRQDALLNAPKKDSDYFRVPKVIEKS